MIPNFKTLYLLLSDLYWLRFKKPGDQWYELTDYLREKLREDGVEIEYTKDDLKFSGYIYDGKYISGSMKKELK